MRFLNTELFTVAGMTQLCSDSVALAFHLKQILNQIVREEC
jgi:hypothetical protein